MAQIIEVTSYQISPLLSLLFFCTATGVATLRDLCPQDKTKVRGLVEELASVGQEKEELEAAIEEDRRQFTLLLDRLKIEHKKVLKNAESLQHMNRSVEHCGSLYGTIPPTITFLCSILKFTALHSLHREMLIHLSSKQTNHSVYTK